MNARLFRTAVSVLAGTLLLVSLGFSAPPDSLSGSISGRVRDSLGVPQMGATVLLYDRFDHVLKRTLTSDKGTFRFDALTAEVYAIRVSLASFLPALKRNVAVQPGMQSLLTVNLATVFSSIELVGVAPGQTSIMSDEWKWVLRSSSATRPVLRLLPELQTAASRKKETTSVFSGTRGVVELSGGDQGGTSGIGSEPDLGTAFALATSFLGSNRLQVSGNVGYSSANGTPTTAFRTSFRRELSGGLSSPEVKLTMRQLALPTRLGSLALGEAPVLRTLSATMLDSKQLTDNVRLEYGMSIDSVSYLDRLNYVSTYGRLSYERVAGESFQIGYASGTPPVEAFLAERETGVEYAQDLSALALFPRVSQSAGAARVQRTETLEAGYRKKAGSRTYAGAFYTDSVTNAAVTMLGSGDMNLGGDMQMNGDLLPDLLSNSYTLNVGRYHSMGYMASFTQSVVDGLDLAMVYGSGGALTANPKAMPGDSLADLRTAFRTERRHSLTARVSGTAPHTGTEFVTSYQWANVTPLNAAHMYLTQRVREGQGLNFRVRQPLPYFGGLPGRLELSAEVRNLLAQGYIPFSYGARRVYLMQTPRTVRGGVSFIF
jgi:hypothetical protein